MMILDSGSHFGPLYFVSVGPQTVLAHLQETVTVDRAVTLLFHGVINKCSSRLVVVVVVVVVV